MGARVQVGTRLRSYSEWWIPFVATLLALAAILVLVAGDGVAPERRLAISLIADQSGSLQVYYDQGGGFSERDSASIEYAAGANTLSLLLPDGALKALRLDPDSGGTRLQLQKIAIETHRQGQSLPQSLAGVRPLNEIAALEHGPMGLVVSPVPGAKDPQLLLHIQDDMRPASMMEMIGRVSQVFLLLMLGAWVVCRLSRSSAGLPIPALLFGAWLLVVAMAFASTTSRSVHPDEYSHVRAAQYYLDHWKPPAVDLPEIVESYSAYGASYLNELDVVYLIAAKSTQFWAGFGLDEIKALRLFNVMLFGVLLLTALLHREAWAGVAVMLLTPQLWYTFAYFNADAFPLFLSLLIAILFGARNSPVSRYIDGKQATRLALLVFILAVGLLLVSKRNYLPVAFMAGLSLMMRHLELKTWVATVGVVGLVLLMFSLIGGDDLVHMFPHAENLFVPTGLVLLGLFVAFALRAVIRDPLLRPRLYRLGLLFTLAVAVALPRIAADIAVNGTPAQKSASVAIAAERHADPQFKPSSWVTNPSSSDPGLNLAAKGVTLWQVVGQPYNWGTKTWYSMLGVYGYLNIFAPTLFYWLIGAGIIMLLLRLVGETLISVDARRDLFVATAGIALVILSSIIHSWANDFQPQGRYLLPSFAIIAAYLASCPAMLRTPWVSIAVAMCFLGSVLSFVGVALPALAGH